MRKRRPYKNDVAFMKGNVTQKQANKNSLVPPQNPQELMPLIEKIKDEKLRKVLTNLIMTNIS